MKDESQSLPQRGSAKDRQIDTRPIYIEEWLDSLPYIDFEKTSQLLFEATRLTNEQPLKPSVRLELVGLYNRPYQYYIDSQIKAGAQHTLQSIDTMQAQIRILKRIAVNLGLACKLSTEDTLKKKTLWGQSKPPLVDMLLSLNYLSHALIFSFLEYAPSPRNIWREINFIYDFAESIRQENATVVLSKNFSGHGSASISQAYKRIALAALADPHHLPYGAIWEIYEQLNSWADLVTITEFSKPEQPECRFVVKLNSDSSPLPCNKFNMRRATNKHRLLDGTELVRQTRDKLTRVEQDGMLDDSMQLSPYYAKMLLEHMSRVWSNPPKRSHPRKDREGRLEIACGLNSVYYFINSETEFIQPVPVENQNDITAGGNVNDDIPLTPTGYKTEHWSLVDQSSRGLAVIRNIKPSHKVRVGDLVIIRIRAQDSTWATGVIRWLMIRQDSHYKLGVQILSLNATPAAARAVSGSSMDTRYRRALLIRNQQDNNLCVITSKGLFVRDRELEIMQGETLHKVRAGSLRESTTGFELFAISNTA